MSIPIPQFSLFTPIASKKCEYSKKMKLFNKFVWYGEIFKKIPLRQSTGLTSKFGLYSIGGLQKEEVIVLSVKNFFYKFL